MGERTVNGQVTEEQRLDQIAIALNQLPRKERSLREQITYLSPSILEALEKGYSYKDVTELLKAKGVVISISTLKQYVYKLKQAPIEAQSESTAPINHPEETLNRRFVAMPDEL
jgi:IS30 family transposase